LAIIRNEKQADKKPVIFACHKRTKRNIVLFSFFVAYCAKKCVKIYVFDVASTKSVNLLEYA